MHDNFNYDNADSDFHHLRPRRLGNCTFHPPISMGSKGMQLFWLLPFMGSDESFESLIFSLLIISSSFDIKELQSMGSVKYCKAFVYPREYPSSLVCVNQPKGTSPCLLIVQREQIFLSYGVSRSTKSSSLLGLLFLPNLLRII